MQCPICKTESRGIFCTVKAEEFPLICPSAADPEDLKKWSQHEHIHTDGQSYNAVFAPNGKGGTDLDLQATLASPRVKPKTIEHLHFTCPSCGYKWVEKVEELKAQATPTVTPAT